MIESHTVAIRINIKDMRTWIKTTITIANIPI